MNPTESGNNPWIRFERIAADEQVRLFCFPYAGGGASSFLPWKPLLPDYVSLFPVQLPGHEERFGERAIVEAEGMCAALAEALSPYLEGSFAFFGHSMGGLLAFRFARWLHEHGRRLPVHLFLSAAPVPVRPPDVTGAPSDVERFIERILKAGTVPGEVMLNAESLEVIRETLKNDDTLLISMLDDSREALEVPVTVLAGEKDLLIPMEMAGRWCSYTSAVSSMVTYPGGHFYIRKWRSDVIELISQTLMMYTF